MKNPFYMYKKKKNTIKENKFCQEAKYINQNNNKYFEKSL